MSARELTIPPDWSLYQSFFLAIFIEPIDIDFLTSSTYFFNNLVFDPRDIRTHLMGTFNTLEMFHDNSIT